MPNEVPKEQVFPAAGQREDPTKASANRFSRQPGRKTNKKLPPETVFS